MGKRERKTVKKNMNKREGQIREVKTEMDLEM